MFKMRLVISLAGYINLILLSYIFWNNAPQRLYGEPLAGTVIDATTGKPIPGAYVSYLWQSATDPKGFFGSGGRTICYHAAGTVTDGGGHFHVGPWSYWNTYRVANQDPHLLLYKSGYEPVSRRLHDGDTVPPISRLRERYELRPESHDTQRQIDSLFWGFSNQSCDYGGESQKTLYPMLKAVYYDARQIASTPRQTQTVRSIARFAARAALSPNPDGPGHTDRVNTFVEEHLQ